MSGERRSRATRGYAALVVICLLCLAAALSLAAVERTVVTHQRMHGHALRHAVAFAAAEAGLDWTLSRLADPRAIDVTCSAAPAASGRSFLQTYLDIAPSDRNVRPTSGHDPSGTPVVLQPTCTRDTTASAGWQCRCPADGRPGTALVPTADADQHPSFIVRFEPASAPGALRIVATGCTQIGGPCMSSPGPVDAVAQIVAVQAMLPALVTLPSAALTALGDVSSSAMLEVRNTDAASGGTAVQAGGVVDLPNAVIVSPAGSSDDGAVLAHDGTLATTSGDQLFGRLTALDRPTWRRLANVQAVDCTAPTACATALAATTARVPGPALLRIDGDATLAGPLVLGTADQPVLLVVAGRLTLSGAVQMTGLVEAGSVVWNHAAATSASNGGVVGALLSEGTFGGDGSPRIAYDLGVLERLRATGQAVHVPGGWKDF